MATRVDRIVIPLDGSHTAERAVPIAAYLGALLGARIDLLTVTDKRDHSAADLNPSVQRSLTRAESLLRSWTGPVCTTVMSGKPASAIAEHAGDDSTLVTMATRGRMGAMRTRAVSVAEDVLKASNSPVLLVRSNDDPLNLHIAERIHSLLVPLDMTKSGENALPIARLFAEKLRTEVVLLYAGESVDARGYMEGVRFFFSSSNQRVRTETRNEEPGPAIVGYAASMTSPMIFMSSDRSKIATRRADGSVTDYVVRNTRCPVLVCPYTG